MNALLDHLLVTLAIMASAVYAFTRLATRPMKLTALSMLSYFAQALPAALGGSRVRDRIVRAAEHQSLQSGCGACGTCGTGGGKTTAEKSGDDAGAIAGEKSEDMTEHRIDAASIGHRGR